MEVAKNIKKEKCQNPIKGKERNPRKIVEFKLNLTGVQGRETITPERSARKVSLSKQNLLNVSNEKYSDNSAAEITISSTHTSPNRKSHSKIPLKDIKKNQSCIGFNLDQQKAESVKLKMSAKSSMTRSPSKSFSTSQIKGAAAKKESMISLNSFTIAAAKKQEKSIRVMRKEEISNTTKKNFLRKNVGGQSPKSDRSPLKTNIKRNDKTSPSNVGDSDKGIAQQGDKSLKLLEELKLVFGEYSGKHFDKDSMEKLKNVSEIIFTSLNDGNGSIIQSEQWKEFVNMLDNLYKTKNNLCADSLQLLDSSQEELTKCKELLRLEENKKLDLKKLYDLKMAKLQLEFKDKLNNFDQLKNEELNKLTKELKMSQKINEELLKTAQEAEDGAQKSIENLQKNLFLEEKLKKTEEILQEKSNEIENKNETIQKLTSQFEELKAQMEQSFTREEKFKKIHNDELSNLQSFIKSVENQRSEFEEKLKEMEQKMRSYSELKNMLSNADGEIKQLKQYLEQQSENFMKSKMLQLEQEEKYDNLLLSKREMLSEIEELNEKQLTYKNKIKQLEQELNGSKQLLDVRSIMINSMQSEDKNQKGRLEDLYIKLGESNKTVTELNQKLHAKSEEVQELYKNQNKNQIELMNKSQIIKNLEESHQRFQVMRVKQEAKIDQMQADIASLQQTIFFYQHNAAATLGPTVLPQSYCCTDAHNENFYYYTSQRKQKRNTDIRVKKYDV